MRRALIAEAVAVTDATSFPRRMILEACFARNSGVYCIEKGRVDGRGAHEIVIPSHLPI